MNDTLGDFSFLEDVRSESLSVRMTGILEDLLLASSDSCTASLIAILGIVTSKAFGREVGIGVSFITDFESLLVSSSDCSIGCVVCGSG